MERQNIGVDKTIYSEGVYKIKRFGVIRKMIGGEEKIKNGSIDLYLMLKDGVGWSA